MLLFISKSVICETHFQVEIQVIFTEFGKGTPLKLQLVCSILAADIKSCLYFLLPDGLLFTVITCGVQIGLNVIIFTTYQLLSGLSLLSALIWAYLYNLLISVRL